MAGIGALKGVKVAICGIKCIDLTKEAIKVLGAFFSYDKNLQLENVKYRTEESNTRGQNNYFQNISFIKNYFLGSSFRNSKSVYRRIATKPKIFFKEFIFSENET